MEITNRLVVESQDEAGQSKQYKSFKLGCGFRVCPGLAQSKPKADFELSPGRLGSACAWA